MKKRLLMLLVLGGLFVCIGCQNQDGSQDSQEEIQKETEVDSSIGEGAPETEVIIYEAGTEYKTGDVISIVSETQEYELVIDAAAYIEATNVHAEEPEQVVLIDYTYTNHSEELLLIDSMRFQLLNETKDAAYEPYYFEEKITAEPAGKGESISAQLAFAKEDDSNELILVYRDTKDNNVQPVSVRINNIGNMN